MFHTPPIKAAHTTTTTTDDPLSVPSVTLLNNDVCESDNDDDLPQNLPRELSELVKSFLKDLQAPKYSKPISADQLSDMFQDFYSLFLYRAELFVKGSVFYKSRVSQVELLTKEEQDERKRVIAQFDKRVKHYVELAEQEITVKVFDRLFNKFEDDVSVNKYIKKKIIALQKVRDIDYPDFIDVEGVDLKLPAFQTLSSKLSELSTVKSPASKLSILLSIHSSINVLVKEQLHTSQVSGDHILPLFIYLVLIHSENTDLYLHFLFISRFRNSTYLTAEPLYCLTNFEAALAYTRTLILTQDSLDFSQLTDDEHVLLSQPSDLPVRKSSIVPLVNDESGSIMSPIPMTAAGIKTLGNALDTGLKSIVGKFGEEQYNPLKGFAAGVMGWRSTPMAEETGAIDVLGKRGVDDEKVLDSTVKVDAMADVDPEKSSLDLTRFDGLEFKDLTVGDLERVWKDYRELVRQYRS